MDMNVLHSSVKSGFEKIAGKAPMSNPLSVYRKLKPAHFKTLIQKYGEEKVVRYIQHMEHQYGLNSKTA